MPTAPFCLSTLSNCSLSLFVHWLPLILSYPDRELSPDRFRFVYYIFCCHVKEWSFLGLIKIFLNNKCSLISSDSALRLWFSSKCSIIPFCTLADLSKVLPDFGRMSKKDISFCLHYKSVICGSLTPSFGGGKKANGYWMSVVYLMLLAMGSFLNSPSNKKPSSKWGK